MLRKAYILVVLSFLMSVVPVLSAAQEEMAVYTFTSHWEVPRAQWAEVTAASKEFHPIFERLVADGTIVAWGDGARIVHVEDAATHGSWFSATSLAKIERALEEFAKIPFSPVLNDAVHHDHIARSLIHKGRTSATTTVYEYGATIVVEPNRGDDWLELWKKHTKPAYDKLLADGVILSYEVTNQQVHTSNPRLRRIRFITSNLENMEKAFSILAAARQQQGPSRLAFRGVRQWDEHRCSYWRLASYGHQ